MHSRAVPEAFAGRQALRGSLGLACGPRTGARRALRRAGTALVAAFALTVAVTVPLELARAQTATPTESSTPAPPGDVAPAAGSPASESPATPAQAPAAGGSGGAQAPAATPQGVAPGAAGSPTPAQVAPGAEPAPAAQPPAAQAAPVPQGGSRPGVAPAPVVPQGGGQTPAVIVDIQFQGTVNTSTGELLTNLASRVGGPLDAVQVTRDIKTLFGLGYFQQVRAEAEEVPGHGFILRFVVKEKPRVVAVALQGNTQLNDKDLFKEITIEVGSFYSKSLAEENADKIRAAYRNKGYLKVKVTPQAEQVDEYSYRLVFHIEESPRLYITDIRVRGSHVFTEQEILRMMQSAEVDCFDWITDSGVFNEDKVNQDLQIIAARYLEIGYVRLFIEKPKVTLITGPDYSRIVVELNITEGAQYFTGKVDVTGDILGDKQTLLDALGLQSGTVFNALQQNRDTFALREIYQEQGYAFVQVNPDLRINDETHIVDVNYQVVRGDKAYIGRIDFQGNRETRDYVMRREFSVQENELYNGRKLRESQQRLNALGFFVPGSLDVSTEPRTVDNVLDVVTKVEEAQTGTLQAQLGYSDQSGVTLATTISKGNFRGRGQTLRGSISVSQRGVTQDISSDFIEPHLFDSDFSSDSSVAFRRVEDQTELNRGVFKEIFGSQGFGHPIIGPLRVNLALAVLNRKFDEPDINSVRLRTFTTSLIYDTVNHPIFPTAGSNITLAVSQIGGPLLRGSTEYRRYRIRAQRFISLNESGSLIATGRLRLGWLQQVGHNVIPAEERFRLGGITTLRGYQFNEVGGPYGSLERSLNTVSSVELNDLGQPVLDSTGNPILVNIDKRTLGLPESTLENLRGGGIMERLLNLELLFPLAGNNIRGLLFYDAGQVNAESIQYQILKADEPGFFDVLQSVGTGVRMITPLGVFRFEYGIKLKRQPGESGSAFDFTIGTLF
jgi:outer membrane protein insertion porin family